MGRDTIANRGRHIRRQKQRHRDSKGYGYNGEGGLARAVNITTKSYTLSNLVCASYSSHCQSSAVTFASSPFLRFYKFKDTLAPVIPANHPP
jgi:hypothetical protein